MNGPLCHLSNSPTVFFVRIRGGGEGALGHVVLIKNSNHVLGFAKNFPHSYRAPHLALTTEEDGDVKQAHQEGEGVRGLQCLT
jgi:hypothetical protein